MAMSYLCVMGNMPQARISHMLRNTLFLRSCTHISRCPTLLKLPSLKVPQDTNFSISHVRRASDHAVHDHSKMWSLERALSAGLVGFIPLAFFYPNPAFDYALALALTTHIHWGIEAVVIDYARPSVVGPVLSRVAVAAVYFLSVFTLGGLFYFNYNDVGLVQAIKMLWTL